ncbi:MAG TPA: hypothetical protein VNN09_15320, partial [Candidatus Competibacteraceae bacterium]|nr:hypothetical protein [Candidatus Competibacteraceae bacterium]
QASRDRPEFGHALFIGDDGERLLRLLDPARHVGEYLRSGCRQARDLQVFFQECWSKALPDSELRRLGI